MQVLFNKIYQVYEGDVFVVAGISAVSWQHILHLLPIS
jgi:hypothetical protein